MFNVEKNGMGGAYSVWEIAVEYTGFWWGNLKERDHWGDKGVDGRITIR